MLSLSVVFSCPAEEWKHLSLSIYLKRFHDGSSLHKVLTPFAQGTIELVTKWNWKNVVRIFPHHGKLDPFTECLKLKYHIISNFLFSFSILFLLNYFLGFPIYFTTEIQIIEMRKDIWVSFSKWLWTFSYLFPFPLFLPFFFQKFSFILFSYSIANRVSGRGYSLV